MTDERHDNNGNMLLPSNTIGLANRDDDHFAQIMGDGELAYSDLALFPAILRLPVNSPHLPEHYIACPWHNLYLGIFCQCLGH
jgi:hypothetical protein